MGIRSRILLISLFLFTAGLSVTYLVAERDIKDTLQDQIVNELSKQSSLLLENINDLNNFDRDYTKADNVADRLAKSTKSRVTFILNDGTVIGDSEVDLINLKNLDNHNNRFEVIEAYKNGYGWSSRYSDTLKQEQLYYAVLDNGVPPNIIRIAVPSTYLDEALASFDLSILLIVVVSIIVAIISSGIAANYAYKSIESIANAAQTLAQGKFKKTYIKKLPTQRVDEFGSVARSISQISDDLKNQVNLLAKQRDQFGLVLDDLGEGILVCNKKGEVQYSNEQFMKILDINRSSISNIYDIDISAINYLFKRSNKKKKADIEFEIIQSNKKTKWVLGSMNQSKTTKEFILVVHDVTELRQLSSMRRDFISNVSHELRTPVSVIRANSETLVSGALEDKNQAKIFAKAIMYNAERLTEMVQDLIDLSRIEYGELNLEIKELDLNDTIKDIIDSLSNLEKEKNIKLIFKPKKNFSIKTDFKAIERILINLLDNAFKYSKDNSVVEVKHRQLGQLIEISVIDYGSGLSSEDKIYVFDRFFRTAEARASDKKGSGLGLAIVKNLVLSLKGEVGIRNNPKGGSIFWFTIPLIYKK